MDGAANAQRAQATNVFLRQSHGRTSFAAGAIASRESRLPFRGGQLKAWALREAWRQNNEGSHGMLTWIAKKLVKIWGGQPTVAAVKALTLPTSALVPEHAAMLCPHECRFAATAAANAIDATSVSFYNLRQYFAPV